MHPLLARAQTVIFDMDGTLVTSNIDFARLNATALSLAQEVGYPVETLTVSDALGIVYAVCDWLEDGESFRQRAFFALERIEAEVAVDAVPRLGAIELVSALRRDGVAVGVMTRNSGRLAADMLREFEHQALVSRDDVRRVKLDPEHIGCVLSRLRRTADGLCVIGDHPMDVRAGKHFDAMTIAVQTPGRDPVPFAKADLVVAELADLL